MNEIFTLCQKIVDTEIKMREIIKEYYAKQKHHYQTNSGTYKKKALTQLILCTLLIQIKRVVIPE